MSASLAPVNFTLSDNSPLFQYYPSRDGPLDSSWNVTYSGNVDSQWALVNKAKDLGNVAVGTSSHRTSHFGAYVNLEWTGTAVILYGNASSGSYKIAIDGGSPVSGAGSVSDILVSYSGLAYGDHTLTLYVANNVLVTVSGATITTGMGAVGSTLQVQNISVASDPNGFFTFQPTWALLDYSMPGISPMMEQFTIGASMSFTLNSTSGFAIIGGVNYNQGMYTVTVTPPASIGPPVTTQCNASSRWFDPNQTKYLQTGMDRTQSYSVVIVNQGNTYIEFTTIEVFDAIPPSSTPLPSGASVSSPLALSATASASILSSPSSHQKLNGGAIGGMIAGIIGVAILIMLVVLWIMRRRRRLAELLVKTAQEPFLFDRKMPQSSWSAEPSWSKSSAGRLYPPVASTSTRTNPPFTSTGPSLPDTTRNSEEGLAAPSVLPPEYDDSWTTDRQSLPPSQHSPSSRPLPPLPPLQPLRGSFAW